MDVEAAAPGRFQHRGRQDQAIGRDHGGIEAERREFRLRRRILAQPGGRAHRKAQPVRRDMHGAAPHRVAATGGAGRLAIHGGDVVSGGVQRREGGHREIRAAHEGEAEPAAAHSAAFCCLSSFASRRSSMLRFSAERWSTKSTPSRCSISCCRQVASSPSASISLRAPASS